MSLVVVIGISFDFKGFSLVAVKKGEVFPIGACGLYYPVSVKVAENDRKFSVLYFYAPNINQKKKFVFDSLFGGGYALFNVYCRAKS